MELKQLSKWIVIAGTLIIWSIKFIIRPLQLFEEPGRLLLNIAPNLLGSFLIPFAAYWFFCGRNYALARLFRINTPYDLRLVCVLGFGMLVVNEYLQQIPVFGRTFDYNDIISSSMGLFASCLVFGKLRQNKTQYQVQAG